MKICIIPARAGSTRIIKKNIRNFCGKPIIAWPIEVAKKTKLFDHIIVSTDDDEIAEIAESYGALAPFRRPDELSDNFTVIRPVVNHAIHEVEKLFGYPDYVCVIFPTAALIQANDIKHGLDKMVSLQTDFAFSITNFSYPIQRALKLTSANKVEMFQPQYLLTRTQDIEPAYHDAGQFYWGKTDSFLSNQNTFSGASHPVILPNWRVVDIDNEEDWKQAELIFRSLNKI